MRCVVCKQSDTQPGRVTVTLDRPGLTYVVKNVPALVCPNCGEDYVEADIASSILQSAESMARAGAQVYIREYAVA